jgi:hypothetical protein
MTVTADKLTTLTAEDAYAFMARLIHDHIRAGKIGELGNHGFDIYLPQVIDRYLPADPMQGYPSRPISITGKPKANVHRAFFDASWQMCLAGLLRPSSADDRFNGQNAGQGDGYSFTAGGLKWFTEGDAGAVVLSTGRIGQLLAEHGTKFGAGYMERSQQAVICHNARAFVASCAMSGAASESILLTVAIAKEKDEAEVIKKYKAQSGRSAIEKIIFGGKKDAFVNQFKSGLELLKYWRDESAHGHSTGFDDVEATVAINQLLRFVQRCNENWDSLVS